MRVRERQWCLGLLAFFFVQSPAFSADPPPSPTLDREAERAQMLSVLNAFPEPQVEIVQAPGTDLKNQALAQYFAEQIWPQLYALRKLAATSGIYHIALDRGLYRDAAEDESWKKLKVDAENEYNRLCTDPKWQATVKEFAALAEGLTGQIADFARLSQHDIEVQEFTSAEQPLLEALNTEMTEISQTANKSPLVKGQAAATKEANDVEIAYRSGKLPFNEAWKALEAITPRGRGALGQDVAIRASEHLNKAAVIRSQLAKTKGYSNWAEYQLATQARTYAPGLQTAQEKLAFLERILELSEKPYLDFLSKRLKEVAPEMSVRDLRSSQVSLLSLQDTTLLRPYFPKERFETIWAETMLQSGFSRDLLKQIHLDGFPRDGKQTHAYMSDVITRLPKVLKINERSLNLDLPPVSAADWFDPEIYINQNYMDDGISYLSTAFHEGGHSTHLGNELDILGVGSAYSYVEVHSFFMENFAKDPEFLKANGVSREGDKLSDHPEVLEQYLRNGSINELAMLRRQVAQAWYDIAVWDYDYEKGPENFIEHSKKTMAAMLQKMRPGEYREIGGVDPLLSGFSTNHYYSGNVRYFGYIGAFVGADVTYQAVLDRLEKATGRRTLYQQPSLAQNLLPLYQFGFQRPFPANIERFTDRAFSPDAYVEKLAKAAREYTCTELLDQK